MRESADYRQIILKDLTNLKGGVHDLRNDLSLFFVTDSHISAASRNAMIVTGHRQSGKTALFNFLLDSSSNQGTLNDIGAAGYTIVEGFSTEMFSATNLSTFARFGNEPKCKAFWLALICVCISRKLKDTRVLSISHEFHTQDFETLARLGELYVNELIDWLRDVNKESRMVPLTVMYDNIEMVDEDVRDLLIRSLLIVWSKIIVEFSFIRPKLFINTHVTESFFSIKYNVDLRRIFAPSMAVIAWDRK